MSNSRLVMNKEISQMASGFRGKYNVFKQLSEFVIDQKVKSHMLGSAEAYLLCAIELESLDKKQVKT